MCVHEYISNNFLWNLKLLFKIINKKYDYKLLKMFCKNYIIKY